jgi:conjugal transfer mating pair stabilization protein TraN
MDGSSQQCTQTTVSKSTFDNYSCSADVAVSKTCTRDTQITGHYENQVSTKTVVISPATLVFTKIDDNTLGFALPLDEPGAPCWKVQSPHRKKAAPETRFLARN